MTKNSYSNISLLLAAGIFLSGCGVAPVEEDPQAIVVQQGAAIQSAQQNPAVISLLEEANRLQSAGDLPGASASLERAIRIAPRDARLRERLGWLRLSQNDPFQAKALARMAVAYSSGNPELQASAWELIAASEAAIGNTRESDLAREEANRLRQRE